LTATRPILFWIATIAAITTAVALLHQILLPFVAGLALAYLLSPLTDRIERLCASRLVASLLTIGTLVVALVGLTVITAPIVVSELVGFLDDLPRLLAKLNALAADPSRPWLQKLVGDSLAAAQQSVGELTGLGAAWIDDFADRVWSGGQAVISIFSLLFVAPIVAVYLLYDWAGIISTLDTLPPPSHRATVRMLARDMDEKVGGFVRGQAVICLILGVLYAAALSVIGLRHGVLMGFASGLLGFIPYIGPLAGCATAACIGLAQFWPDFKLIFAIPLIFLLGSSLSDYALTPFLIGPRINLSPVWIAFAMFAFGNMFGLVGLLIAAPLAAAIGVLVRFGYRQYLASVFYDPK
jgi:predicted PurR-regulated permease PerM